MCIYSFNPTRTSNAARAEGQEVKGQSRGLIPKTPVLKSEQYRVMLLTNDIRSLVFLYLTVPCKILASVLSSCTRKFYSFSIIFVSVVAKAFGDFKEK